MIVSLQGTLVEAGIFRAVIACAGVGYEVNIPVSTAEKLPKIGAEVHLYTLQTFREDGQALYGFHSAEERNFFKLLIEKVSGVGPSIALKIFSRLSLPVLQDAIRRDDIALLSQCPGIGKKTAERLIIELRDKLDLATRAQSAKRGAGNTHTDEAETHAPDTPSAQADAVAALMALGFKLDQADKAVRQALAKAPDNASTETLIRLALGN